MVQRHKVDPQSRSELFSKAANREAVIRVTRLVRLAFAVAMVVASGITASCKQDPLATEARKLAEKVKRDPDAQITLEDKSKSRAREIQLLVNIIMPDPRYQPWYLSDEADVFGIFGHGENTIRQRLEGYFGKPLRFELRHRQPLWSLVDEIKKAYPGWPDGWE